VRVELHTGDHCIETAAKNEFRRLMDSYFAAPPGRQEQGIEEKLALLRDFLDTSDFPALRASDPRLSGYRESRIRITRDARKRVILLFDS
jgi:hypothetical protein